MTNILEKYRLPWKVVNQRYIETSNGKTFDQFIAIIIVHRLGLDVDLLEFITETINNSAINNSARPRITDTLCDCDCGWTGTVGNCLPDIDGDGDLGCPRCQAIVEVIA